MKQIVIYSNGHTKKADVIATICDVKGIHYRISGADRSDFTDDVVIKNESDMDKYIEGLEVVIAYLDAHKKNPVIFNIKTAFVLGTVCNAIKILKSADQEEINEFEEHLKSERPLPFLGGSQPVLFDIVLAVLFDGDWYRERVIDWRDFN